MSVLILRVDTTDTDVFVQTNNAIVTASNLAQLFKSMAGGGRMKRSTLRTDVTPVAASGTLTLEDGVATGTIGGVINGVTITVTYATSITVAAAAIAAAINASVDALVANLVTATSALGVVTVTAIQSGVGTSGNAITLAASGTGVTASGARLTGGTNGTSTAFSY